jgi:chemotaxis signal transduction protein
MNDNMQPDESFVLFEVAGTTYALPSHSVQQMEMIEKITTVPNAPGFVAGIVFIRGKVVPAIDLRLRFGLEPIPYSLRTRLIVVNTNGRSVGLIADSAREFIRVPGSAIQPPPEALAALSGNYLRGVFTLGSRLVLLIDIDPVLDPGEELIYGKDEA